ncbi:hypothetical protein [Desulfonema magnum]|uniref:Uncharacterized protein n=1 Tax=Desulfonema magnum TaxID=45655 RepID=A0A975BL13_9BACT|nr:hypothetical protein [Desulfonema magnum]QTA87451.1 Uncharacterized protein dnm_034850 [Desulfonema magnum]
MAVTQTMGTRKRYFHATHWNQEKKTFSKLVPTQSVTAIKLSFRSAKIIFRIPAGNSFCDPG